MTGESEYLAREMCFLARLLVWATRNNGAPPAERFKAKRPVPEEAPRLAA